MSEVGLRLTTTHVHTRLHVTDATGSTVHTPGRLKAASQADNTGLDLYISFALLLDGSDSACRRMCGPSDSLRVCLDHPHLGACQRCFSSLFAPSPLLSLPRVCLNHRKSGQSRARRGSWIMGFRGEKAVLGRGREGREREKKGKFSTLISETSPGTSTLICSGIPRCRSLQIRTSHSRMFDVGMSEAGEEARFQEMCLCCRAYAYAHPHVYFVIPMCVCVCVGPAPESVFLSRPQKDSRTSGSGKPGVTRRHVMQLVPGGSWVGGWGVGGRLPERW